MRQVQHQHHSITLYMKMNNKTNETSFAVLETKCSLSHTNIYFCFVKQIIDPEILKAMSDQDLSKFLVRYGDRIALKTFLHEKEKKFKKAGLLDKLRTKIKGNRRDVDSSSDEDTSSKGLRRKKCKTLNNYKETRKVEIGWLHRTENEVKQVRTSKGGSTRIVDIKKSSKK